MGLLRVETYREHGIEPARFGVLACPRAELMETIERFEQAAGLPSPRPGGVWNKSSPWIKRSYFFLTGFRESQFDEALAIARRGGFHIILIGQDSWCQTTGHYEVNRNNFPDGVDGLKRTVQKFKEAGFRVGLHFLAASMADSGGSPQTSPASWAQSSVASREASVGDPKSVGTGSGKPPRPQGRIQASPNWPGA